MAVPRASGAHVPKVRCVPGHEKPPFAGRPDLNFDRPERGVALTRAEGIAGRPQTMREATITDYIPTTFDCAPILESALWLCGLFVLAAIGSWIARQIVLRTIERLLDRLTIDDAMPSIPKVVGRLARAVPALIVGGGIHVVPHLPAEARAVVRSEEHTSELQSLMRISHAVFC